ncbi:TonB-dependent receptor [Flavobacteriaceae bacterium]|jgi:outer membrane receptor protein involved in Fe transport|nr:TonB-dependent receptor [Flavobacteriaceae bacterium]MDB4559713.1 TonB-dependent receptor [Flavobacteriaceae bacterium]MDC3227429.1 TonB-dependent receptor [bacterium]
MNKTSLFFVAFTITFLSVFSQKPQNNQISITGNIIDSNTKEPLEYATVVLNNIETKQLSGGITDEKGNFTIKIIPGTYDISFEFISFKTIKIPKKIINSSVNFGTIKLSEDSDKLDEIVIIAEKSTVEIRLDKRIYNVGKDMTVKGGSASDVLDNVPSVDVDVEGNVSLRGNENVRILIDGKPSALVGLSGTEALRQLPADAIERVEVVTSPSARYDAEGTAGILNIILRKGVATGLNGSLNTTIGDPTQYRIASNINFRTKKINFFTNLGYRNSSGPGNFLTNLSTFENESVNSLRIEDRDFERNRNGYNINLGLEYFLSNESSITGTYFYRDSDNKNLSTNTIQVFDANNILEFSDVRIQDEDEIDETSQISLNYTNNLNSSGHKLTIDFQYSDSKEIETAFIDDALASEKNITTENSKSTLIQSDYVLPIGEHMQFELGYRGDFQDLNSNFLVNRIPELDFNPSNNLIFKQNVNAIYSQFGNKISKFSYLLGLRTEITDVKVRLTNTNENFDYRYTEVFPTINFGLERTDNQSFTLGYSRRLRRPRYWYLNPFESRNSQNVIYKGNPGLIPTFTNSFDLGFLQKIGKLTLNSSIYFQHSVNAIQRVTRDEIRLLDGVNQVITIREPINLASEDRYGFELTANYNPSKKVRLSGSFNVFQQESKGLYEYNKFTIDETSGAIISSPEIQDLGNINNSWFSRFNATFTLPWKIQMQNRLSYRGPRYTAQSESKGMFSANIALSKDVFSEKGTLVLNVSDVFNSRKWRSTNFNPNKENPTSINSQESQWRVRQISLNFTYRFNQKKNQGRERRGGEDYEGDEGFSTP